MCFRSGSLELIRTGFEKLSKSSKCDVGRVGGRLSRRRRPHERIGFVVLSRGAHPSSIPDPTLRDLCPILSLVGACHLPAMRAQEFTRASLARQSLAATFVARSRWHPRSSRHLNTVRAAHSIAGRARVASPALALPCRSWQRLAAFHSLASALSRATRSSRSSAPLATMVTGFNAPYATNAAMLGADDDAGTWLDRSCSGRAELCPHSRVLLYMHQHASGHSACFT